MVLVRLPFRFLNRFQPQDYTQQLAVTTADKVTEVGG